LSIISSNDGVNDYWFIRDLKPLENVRTVIVMANFYILLKVKLVGMVITTEEKFLQTIIGFV
jgi:hypothetical protein